MEQPTGLRVTMPFSINGLTYEAEMRRYDAVIFFESAAVLGIGIETGNPSMKETLAEVLQRSDARLEYMEAPSKC